MAIGIPPLGNSNIMLTPLGGIAVKLINKTGAASIKGLLLNTEASIDDAVNIVNSTVDEPDIIGVFLESGIADGDLAWVVVQGKAEMLIEDGTISTRGYWCRTSVAQDGRADITNAVPPGGTINAIDGHFREIGHCIESKISGTNVLAKVILHFN